MLTRKPTSFTDLTQSWGRQIKAAQTAQKVNPNRGHNGLLVESRLGVDGNYYGILQEADGYFIKTTGAGASAPGPDDFAYIGGLGNRNIERFASLPKALHRLHLKMGALNESAPLPANARPSAGVEDDGVNELLQQLDAAPAPQEAAPMDAAPMDAMGAEPMAGGEPGMDAGLPPEGEAPAADPAGELPPLPAAGGDDDDVTPEKLLSMVGKLGAALDKLGMNLTPQLTASVVKPILTHAAPGLRQLDAEDREQMLDTIKGNEVEDAAPAPEVAPEVAPEAEALNENEDQMRGMHESIEAAESALADRQGSAGTGGRFHEQHLLDKLQQDVANAQHALKHHLWMQKQPKDPRDNLQEGLGDESYGDSASAVEKRNARQNARMFSPLNARAETAIDLDMAQTFRRGAAYAGPNNEDDIDETPEERQAAYLELSRKRSASAHLRNQTGENQQLLPEGMDDFNDQDAGLSDEDHQDNEYSEGFRAYCEYRGYDAYSDESLAQAVLSWAKKVTAKNSPYDADAAGIADLMNPLVWSQVKLKLPRAFAVEVAAEMEAMNAPETAAEPLNEGLRDVLRQLIREQVAHVQGQ